MKRIYIAEDDMGIAELVRLSLAKIDGIALTFFSNGLDLYRKVQEDPPDGVICDIILPGLDGLAAIRLIKFSETYRHVKVLTISSIIDSDIAQQVSSVGADDFLRKPFRPADVREKVKTLMGLDDKAQVLG
jgi:two-component system alkaline phosphatase synthesis response regulator PhoP